MSILEQQWHLIKSEMDAVETSLREIVDAAGPELNSVSDYFFSSRGKKVRPALFLLAAHRPGKNIYPLINGAAAFELIHTASLLHDDVIDQAAARRGKDAVHIKWSNKISILSGDYLLSRAFKLLAGYREWPLIDLVLTIVKDMAEGEVEQAFSDSFTIQLEERYFQWIGKKSAALFAGCCRSGSLLGGGTIEEQDLWSEFGFNLGIAFQLIDDLLDYAGNSDYTGKPHCGDLNNGVLTLPLIRTLSASANSEATDSFFSEDRENEAIRLSKIAQAVLDGDGPDYTYRKAEEYAARAIKALGRMKDIDGSKMKLLKQFAADLLKRRK